MTDGDEQHGREVFIGEVLPPSPSEPTIPPPRRPTVEYIRADQSPPQPPPAPSTTSRTVATVGAVSLTVLAGCVGGIVGAGVSFATMFGLRHLDQVALFAAIVAGLAAGTAATTIRTVSRRRVSTALTLAPWLAGWICLAVWYWQRFPLWYVPWLTAGTVPVAALSAWFWRDHTSRTARQALVYLVGVALVVVANGAGILAVAWQRTDAFGLRGQPTPYAAFEALTATSCLSSLRFHSGGGQAAVDAHCPTGPDGQYYQGQYDTGAFNADLCDEQPRAAFNRWWNWNRTYQIEFVLDFDAPTADITGDTATMTATMTIKNAFHPGDDGPYRVTFDKPTETWHVQAKTATVGGWKICRIDVTDPVTATFHKIN